MEAGIRVFDQRTSMYGKRSKLLKYSLKICTLTRMTLTPNPRSSYSGGNVRFGTNDVVDIDDGRQQLPPIGAEQRKYLIESAVE